AWERPDMRRGSGDAGVGAAMNDDVEFRHYLRALYAEDDRLRAEREHEERLARQAALASSPHDDGGDALLAAPAAEAVCFDEDGAFTLPFSDRQADAIAEVINELRREWQPHLQP